MNRLFVFFILAALVALGFLIFTLFNLRELNISNTHPRVLVEVGLFFIFAILAIFFIFQKRHS